MNGRMQEQNGAGASADKRLTRLLGAARAIVWEYDIGSGKITHQTPFETFGTSSIHSPLALADALQLVHRDDRRRVLARLRRCIRLREPYVQQFRITLGAARLPSHVEDHGAVICDERGQALRVEGVMIDITAHRQTLTALTTADRRKDKFLAVLAHEMRSPLGAIATALHGLKHRGREAALVGKAALHEKTAPDEAYVDMIRRQADHIARLVEDLLDVGRIVSDRIEIKRVRLDLKDVIVRALEMNDEVLRTSGHLLDVALGDQSLDVDGDLVRLTQLFSNLIGNAVKYTGPGGRIGITADRCQSWIIVRVRDSGLGIAAEHLPYVFEPFYQVEVSRVHAQGGLGIGLALVRRVAQLHGGNVSVQSEGSGCGSEFLVRLPVASEPDREGVCETSRATDGSERVGSHCSDRTKRSESEERLGASDRSVATPRRFEAMDRSAERAQCASRGRP